MRAAHCCGCRTAPRDTRCAAARRGNSQRVPVRLPQWRCSAACDFTVSARSGRSSFQITAATTSTCHNSPQLISLLPPCMRIAATPVLSNVLSTAHTESAMHAFNPNRRRVRCAATRHIDYPRARTGQTHTTCRLLLAILLPTVLLLWLTAQAQAQAGSTVPELAALQSGQLLLRNAARAEAD